MKIIPVFLSIFTILSSCSSSVSCNDIIYKDGVSYHKGKKFSGDCESYYPNGKLKSIQTYANGLDHGNWIFYYQNQYIQTKGKFNLGVRVGEWRYFHDNGKLWKFNFYSNDGRKIGNWKTYDINERLIDSVIFP